LYNKLKETKFPYYSSFINIYIYIYLGQKILLKKFWGVIMLVQKKKKWYYDSLQFGCARITKANIAIQIARI